MNRYPIVFIHRGGDSYLGASLTQARVSNPDAEVYLIGDRFNRGFSGVIHLEWQDYARTAREFAKGYQHRETAEYERVLFWFQRWFILNEALRALQLPGCLYLDSDVLLYERLDQLAGSWQEVDLTTSSRYCSPHFTFFPARRTLDEFCSYLLEGYRDPAWFARVETVFHQRQAAGLTGGVCDMTGFFFFFTDRPVRVLDVSTPRELVPCDCTMAENEGGYEMNGNVKRITWREGQPWGHYLPDNLRVRFGALHFQGPAKGRIYDHVHLPSWRSRWRYHYNRLVAKRGKYEQKMRSRFFAASSSSVPTQQG